MIEIEMLDKTRYLEYEDFLISHEQSLFYHSTRYKDFLEDLLGCESRYLLAYDKGKIAHQVLFREYNQFVTSNNVVSSTVVENPINLLTTAPIHNMKDSRIGQLTSIGGYENYEEAIFKIIDGNRRNEIRRAQKHEVTIIEDNSQIDFIRLVHQNEMKKHNRKFKTDEFFCKIHKHFEPGEDFKIFIAYRENRPVAGLLMFYFNKTAEYFMPIVLEEERIFQPMSLILYHALLDAMKRHFKWFNWGGTWLTQEGVYRFKKQMGAIDYPYQYYTQINKLDILKKNPDDILKIYNDFYVYNFSEYVA